MRTTLDIPEALLAEAVELSGEKTSTAAIVVALERFVRQIKMEKLKQFRGAIPGLDADLDRLRGRGGFAGKGDE